MHPFHIPSACFFLLLGFKITCAVPLQSAALTNEDMHVLKLLLHRLEESIPTKLQDQTWPQDDTLVPDLEKTALTEAQDRAQPQLNAKDYLSARDLRTVRHDSSAKRYSGCFSRRLDRIGSMSSLGCNTIGRHNSKRN